ncbi:MAG: IclR family transcriptional regulator C-terminal domain-containing protein [Burkholderiaceae bacterium]
MDIQKADLIAGMAKGMAVLESFDTERQRLNATLAAQRAGITRAAARRHLLTLAHLGYLETDGSYYWLSAKVLRFSGSYLASARLPRVLQPTLNRLAAQTGESYSAVVLDADQVVIVARSGNGRSRTEHAGEQKTAENNYESNSKSANKYADILAYGLHLGARLPAYATSTGRVLLAALSEPEFAAWVAQRRLYRLTSYTCTDVAELQTIIAQTRAQDYAVAHEEHELGVHALAVPLRNMQGRTVAALNVVTSLERLQPKNFQRELLPLLQDAARELRALI